MFKLSEKYQIGGKILKFDYIRYSPSEISTINTANSQVYIIIPREDSVISLLNGYLDLNFDVLHAATGNTYVENDDIKLVNLGKIALFGNYKSTTSSGKHLEDINHAHIVSLLYKILTSSRGSDDLSSGFDRHRIRRQRELTDNKKLKGKYHLRIYLGDIFGFAEHQKTGTFGLGYKKTCTRNTCNAVLNKYNATNKAKIKINAIELYVPHYTPSFEQNDIIMNQIVEKLPKYSKNIAAGIYGYALVLTNKLVTISSDDSNVRSSFKLFFS